MLLIQEVSKQIDIGYLRKMSESRDHLYFKFLKLFTENKALLSQSCKHNSLNLCSGYIYRLFLGEYHDELKTNSPH